MPRNAKASVVFASDNNITNFLLTEPEGRTWQYAVRTERGEVSTKIIEGKYSTKRQDQARLVSIAMLVD